MSARVRGSNKDGRDAFCRFLKMGKDSAVRIELGRSFHQMGTVNEKVHSSEFLLLWDGTIMHRSLLADFSFFFADFPDHKKKKKKKGKPAEASVC